MINYIKGCAEVAVYSINLPALRDGRGNMLHRTDKTSGRNEIRADLEREHFFFILNDNTL